MKALPMSSYYLKSEGGWGGATPKHIPGGEKVNLKKNAVIIHTNVL